jgi:hypothetical protein
MPMNSQLYSKASLKSTAPLPLKLKLSLKTIFQFFPKFSEWEIQQALLKTQLKSSPGDVKIPVSFLRDLRQRHSSTMTEMFLGSSELFRCMETVLDLPIPKLEEVIVPLFFFYKWGKYSREQVLQVATDQFCCRNLVTFDRSQILEKLNEEAPPWLIFFFLDFLSNRSFKVRYKGELTEEKRNPSRLFSTQLVAVQASLLPTKRIRWK